MKTKEPVDEFIVFCFRHRALLAISTILFFVLVLIFKLTSPRFYQSDFSFFVRSAPMAGSGLADILGGSSNEADYLDAVLEGEALRLAVSDAMHLETNEAFWSSFSSPLMSIFLKKRERNAEGVLNQLDSAISIKRRDNSFRVQVQHPDPAFAKELADTIAAALEARVQRDYKEERTQFDDVVEQTRKELLQAEADLKNFRLENQLSLIDEEQIIEEVKVMLEGKRDLAEQQAEWAAVTQQLSIGPGALEEKVFLRAKEIGLDASIQLLERLTDEQLNRLQKAPEVIFELTLLKRRLFELQTILEVQLKVSEARKFQTSVSKKPYTVVTNPRAAEEPEARGTVVASFIGGILGFALGLLLANIIEVFQRVGTASANAEE